MKKITITLFAASALMAACGPSQEEIAAREKAKMDSVAQAAKASMAREKEIEDSTNEAIAYQETLKAQLIDLRAQLEAAQVKLNDVEQFKLLRTADEKEQQITEQTRIVEELRAQIDDIEKQIR